MWHQEAPLTILLVATFMALSSAVTDFGIGFTQWPSREVLGVPGTRVTLPCATNVTAEKISWQYNHHFLLEPPVTSEGEPGGTGGVAGGEGESPAFKVVQTKEGSQLVISLGEEGHFRHQLGLYQCVAWFGAIALTSLPGRLEAAYLDAFPAAGGAAPTRVEGGLRVGEAVRVECGAPPSVPAARLTFYRNGEEVDVEGNPEAYRLTPHGDLLLLNAGVWAAGEYSCTAHNPVLERTVSSPTVTAVKVLQKEGEERKAPEFVSLRTLYTGKKGSSLRMTCLATGNPKPDITWTKYGGALPTRSSQEEDGSLVMESLEVQDEGTYLCHASNGVGSEIMLDVPLEVLESPKIIEAPEPQNVEEGKGVDLLCRALGHPEPKIMWVFNGGLVRNDGNLVITDEGLTIRAIEKKHAGIFQCFAHNPEGTVQAVAMISVVPKTVNAGSHSIPNSDYTPGEPARDRYNGKRNRVSNGSRGRERNGERRGHRRKDNDGNNGKNGDATEELSPIDDVAWKKKGKKGLMVPPSRPNMTKVSDESVMVTWDVHNTTGLPILFYKVQYKEVGNRGNRGSRWMTVDEDILPHINSYEVTGLHTGRVYKFRIAAVYANNDNKLGKTSKRFLLKEDLTMQRPVYPPKITRLLHLSPSAVRLEWEYEPSPGVPVEGFFINYREATTAGRYTKVTVLNPTIRSYEICHLKPNSSYDFKIQCFNIAGTSDFSLIHKKAVAGSPAPTPRPVVPVSDVVPVIKDDEMSLSNIHLYIILGAVLALLLLIVIVSSSIYACRNRNSQDDTRTSKYEDTSLHIHRETTTYSLPQSNRNNGQGPNGYLSHHGSPLRQQNIDQKVPVENAFVENNNHNIQMLRNWQSTPARQIPSHAPSSDGDTGAIEMRNSSLPRNANDSIPVVAGSRDTALR